MNDNESVIRKMTAAQGFAFAEDDDLYVPDGIKLNQVPLLADDVSKPGGCVCLCELWGGLCDRGDCGTVDLY